MTFKYLFNCTLRSISYLSLYILISLIISDNNIFFITISAFSNSSFQIGILSLICNNSLSSTFFCLILFSIQFLVSIISIFCFSLFVFHIFSILSRHYHNYLKLLVLLLQISQLVLNYLENYIHILILFLPKLPF